MSENKTSEAVAQMDENCKIISEGFEERPRIIGQEPVTMRFAEWKAFAEKYKRMEEALKAIATRKLRPEDFCQSMDEGDDCPATGMAEEALSFDPLSK